jgi:hypothetical protein
MNYNDIDFWYYDLGLNIIPIRFKSKQSLILWGEWQDKTIPKELYEKWKKKGFVNNNCAIITGKISRGPYNDKYLVCIDIDNKIGIDEFLFYFTEIKSLEELSQKTMVVQHEDTQENRAHIYFITEKPSSKKTRINGFDTDDEIPAIEVKSDSSAYVVCPPSTHQDGYPYQITGTKQILVLNEDKSKKLEDAINKIYEKYSSNNYNPSTGNFFPYLAKEMEDMIKSLKIDFTVHKISNEVQENTLIAAIDCLLYIHLNSIYIQKLKSFFFKFNQKICENPLDTTDLEILWIEQTSFIENNSGKKNIPLIKMILCY